MNKTIISFMLVFAILLTALMWQIAETVRAEQTIDKLNVQTPQNRITITEPITLIRTIEDYIYLNSLEIDKDIWDNATKHTDINGVTWREIIQDGYIKVYAEGHIMPDSVHWYAPY